MNRNTEIENLFAEAEAAFSNKNYDKAETLGLELLKLDSKHPAALRLLGKSFLKNNKQIEGMNYLKRALVIEPADDVTMSVLIDQIIEADDLSTAEELLMHYQRVNMKDADDDEIVARLKCYLADPLNIILSKAIKLKNSCAYQEALQMLRDAEGNYPNSARLLLLKCSCLILHGELEEADVVLSKTAKLNPSHPELSINKIRILLRQRDIAAAVVLAEKTRGMFPNLFDGILLLGASLSAAGRETEALSYLSKCIELDEESAESYVHRGMLYLRKSKYGNALSDLQKGFELRPCLSQIWGFLLGLHLQAGEYRSGLQAIAKMMDIDPANEYALKYLVDLNNKAGDPEAAAQSFSLALKKRPEDTNLMLNLAEAQIKREMFEAAMRVCKKILVIDSCMPNAHYLLGVIYYKLGDLQKSLEYFETTIALDDKNAPAHNNLGNILKTQFQYQRARSCYLRALELKEDLQDARCNLAIVMYEEGDLESSLAQFSKVISEDPRHSNAWEGFYLALRALGREKRVADYFSADSETALRNNLNFNILKYKLARGTDSAGDFLKMLVKSLDQNDPPKNSDVNSQFAGGNNIVSLTHFGRSGTGLLHSLIDNHPKISTLPSIFLSEYFDPENWKKIWCEDITKSIDNFISIYDVLFDSTSKVPIETKGKNLVSDMGYKEGLCNLGDNRNDSIKVDRVLFKNTLYEILVNQTDISVLSFFTSAHLAYEIASGDHRKKTLIFYHIHNPNVPARSNFFRVAPRCKNILLIRDPVQSCEAWIKNQFLKQDYSAISVNIATMLLEIDDPTYSPELAIGLRLEDLKHKSKQVFTALTNWMGTDNAPSLYEMTAWGKKWWGDPSSPDYQSSGMLPFGTESIDRKVGQYFGSDDQLVLNTLFYPLRVRFGYTSPDKVQFINDLYRTKQLIEGPLEFEVRLMNSMGLSRNDFVESGPFKYLRAIMNMRLEVLTAHHTYPNLISNLSLNE